MSLPNESFANNTNMSFADLGSFGAATDALFGHNAPGYANQAYEVRSDCDSEGNDPPKEGNFVDPLSVEETLVAPPRGETVKLPFFQAADRMRYRQNYESRVGYETWVENEAGAGAGRAHRRDVKKLEDDNDFPVGRPFFWSAFCRTCNKSYHPHVPSQWQCMSCRQKVWQPADDPESAKCGVCKREVEKIRMVGTRKIRNPMTTNSHMCKRCGKIVCDHCYSPETVELTELGYDDPQRICTKCIGDLAELKKPPEDDDIGTLHDEGVAGLEDATAYQPHWAPRCGQCNITYAKPPPKWLCGTCGNPTWQPLLSPESNNCWVCAVPLTKVKVRCHKCGQLVCQSCGAYAQPLVGEGYTEGDAHTVCKCCYQGQSTALKKEVYQSSEPAKPWPAQCPGCKKSFGQAPNQWSSPCHKRKAWQPDDHPKSKQCAICNTALGDGGREHCHKCGNLVCLACSQYKEPLTQMGYGKGQPQPICKICFDPRLGYIPDHTDSNYWPPSCTVCKNSWVKPPDRWRCPNQCGNVWQPLEHIASKSCATCGKKIARGNVNCRRCGRIVCPTCGEGRAEVLERGFTRGLDCPVCPVCIKAIKGSGGSTTEAPSATSPRPGK